MYPTRIAGAFTLRSCVLGVLALTAVLPLHGEQFLFSDRNGFGSIQSIDTSTGITTKVTDTPTLPDGLFGLPEGLLVATNGDIVYSMNFNSPSELAIWNGSTNQTVQLGLGLEEVALAPDGKTVYVGDVSGSSIRSISRHCTSAHLPAASARYMGWSLVATATFTQLPNSETR